MTEQDLRAQNAYLKESLRAIEKQLIGALKLEHLDVRSLTRVGMLSQVASTSPDRDNVANALILTIYALKQLP